ncbi:MAG: hypothetical protein NTU53_18100 [Planctomycetota bacterium]|nr:hypothetical protein [Planctomycetota bacterium]
MTRSQEKIVMGSVVVLAVFAIGYGAWKWRPANNQNYPDGTFWVCQNPACKNEFVLTVKELGEFQDKHYGQPVMCPKCKQQNTIGAERCPSCKKFVSRAQRAATCPYCKQNMNAG